MNIIVNNNISKEKWIALSQASYFNSPYHLPAFLDLYNSIEQYSAHVFALEEGGEYVALLVVSIYKEPGLMSYFSRRAIIHGVPLLHKVEDTHVKALFQYVQSYMRGKAIYIEMRNNFSFESWMGELRDLNWHFNKHLNVQLDVSELSIDDVFSKMKYNRRREVKMSYKEGAKVLYSTDSKEISDLYSLLSELYKTRVKLPLPPESFFQKLAKSSVGFSCIVKHEEKIIGGSFCFKSSNFVSTMYYAGERSYNKKIYPTHLAVIGAIEYAIKNGISKVDFMGAGKPNVSYGVRDYKLQFEEVLKEHGRYLKVLNPILYKAGKIGLNLYKRIIK